VKTSPFLQITIIHSAYIFKKQKKQVIPSTGQSLPAAKKESVAINAPEIDDLFTTSQRNNNEVMEAENNLKSAVIEKGVAQNTIKNYQDSMLFKKYDENYKNTGQQTRARARVAQETTRVKNEIEPKIQSGQELLQKARNKRVADYIAHDQNIVNMVHSPRNTIQILEDLNTAKRAEKQARDTYSAESGRTDFFIKEQDLLYKIEKSAKPVDQATARYNQAKVLEAAERTKLAAHRNPALGYN